MEKLKVGEYYPIAHGEKIPYGYERTSTRVKATEEFRPPREGEWFLSGSIIEGYPALCDMTTPYHIGVLVKGKVITRWVPAE